MRVSELFLCTSFILVSAILGSKPDNSIERWSIYTRSRLKNAGSQLFDRIYPCDLALRYPNTLNEIRSTLDAYDINSNTFAGGLYIVESYSFQQCPITKCDILRWIKLFLHSSSPGFMIHLVESSVVLTVFYHENDCVLLRKLLTINGIFQANIPISLPKISQSKESQWALSVVEKESGKRLHCFNLESPDQLQVSTFFTNEVHRYSNSKVLAVFHQNIFASMVDESIFFAQNRLASISSIQISNLPKELVTVLSHFHLFHLESTISKYLIAFNYDLIDSSVIKFKIFLNSSILDNLSPAQRSSTIDNILAFEKHAVGIYSLSQISSDTDILPDFSIAIEPLKGETFCQKSSFAGIDSILINGAKSFIVSFDQKKIEGPIHVIFFEIDGESMNVALYTSKIIAAMIQQKFKYLIYIDSIKAISPVAGRVKISWEITSALPKHEVDNLLFTFVTFSKALNYQGKDFKYFIGDELQSSSIFNASIKEFSLSQPSFQVLLKSDEQNRNPNSIASAQHIMTFRSTSNYIIFNLSSEGVAKYIGEAIGILSMPPIKINQNVKFLISSPGKYESINNCKDLQVKFSVSLEDRHQLWAFLRLLIYGHNVIKFEALFIQWISQECRADLIFFCDSKNCEMEINSILQNDPSFKLFNVQVQKTNEIIVLNTSKITFEKYLNTVSNGWMNSVLSNDEKNPCPLHRNHYKSISLDLTIFLQDFVDLSEKQILTHRVKDLNRIASLRKYKSDGSFGILNKFYLNYLSLTDFEHVTLFGNSLSNVDFFSGIYIRHFTNDEGEKKAELLLFFEPVEKVYLYSQRLHDYIKYTIEFDKIFKPKAPISNHNILIFITKPPAPRRMVEDSLKMLADPCLLIKEFSSYEGYKVKKHLLQFSLAFKSNIQDQREAVKYLESNTDFTLSITFTSASGDLYAKLFFMSYLTILQENVFVHVYNILHIGLETIDHQKYRYSWQTNCSLDNIELFTSVYEAFTLFLKIFGMHDQGYDIFIGSTASHQALMVPFGTSTEHVFSSNNINLLKSATFKQSIESSKQIKNNSKSKLVLDKQTPNTIQPTDNFDEKDFRKWIRENLVEDSLQSISSCYLSSIITNHNEKFKSESYLKYRGLKLFSPDMLKKLLPYIISENFAAGLALSLSFLDYDSCFSSLHSIEIHLSERNPAKIAKCLLRLARLLLFKGRNSKSYPLPCCIFVARKDFEQWSIRIGLKKDDSSFLARYKTAIELAIQENNLI